MSSLKRNISYQALYQILATCLPLVTSPYLSRVLGAEQLGVYSFTNSIVTYFTLIAGFGVVQYGTRTIAACAGNQETASKHFWSIYCFQAPLALVLLLLYFTIISNFFQEFYVISLIQGIHILSYAFDVNWLYFGLEKFKSTVTRNIAVKVSTVACILVFVKSEDDLWLYTMIMASGMLVNNVVLWVQLPKVVDVKAVCRIRLKDIFQHIRPNFNLFVPQIGVSVYHIMDKTMLGVISSSVQSGYYYNSDKMISIPMGIFDGMGDVLLPRMSALLAQGKQKESIDLFHFSLEFFSALSAAVAFGIAAVAEEFVPLFFGPGYDPCVTLVHFFAPILIVKSFTVVSRMLYLVPSRQEKQINISVFSAASVNLIFNFMLIPRYGALGAVVGTLMAELVCCIIQYWTVMRHFSIIKTFGKVFCYIINGFLMYVVVRLAARALCVNIVVQILLEILIGVFVYGIGCCIIWLAMGRNVKCMIYRFFEMKQHL